MSCPFVDLCALDWTQEVYVPFLFNNPSLLAGGLQPPSFGWWRFSSPCPKTEVRETREVALGSSPQDAAEVSKHLSFGVTWQFKCKSKVVIQACSRFCLGDKNLGTAHSRYPGSNSGKVFSYVWQRYCMSTDIVRSHTYYLLRHQVTQSYYTVYLCKMFHWLECDACLWVVLYLHITR